MCFLLAWLDTRLIRSRVLPFGCSTRRSYAVRAATVLGFRVPFRIRLLYRSVVLTQWDGTIFASRLSFSLFCFLFRSKQLLLSFWLAFDRGGCLSTLLWTIEASWLSFSPFCVVGICPFTIDSSRSQWTFVIDSSRSRWTIQVVLLPTELFVSLLASVG